MDKSSGKLPLLASTINLEQILGKNTVLHLYCDTSQLRVASLYDPEAFYDIDGTDFDAKAHRAIGRAHSLEKALHRALYTLRTGRTIEAVKKPRKILGRQLQLGLQRGPVKSSSLLDDFIAGSRNEITLTRDIDKSVIVTMAAFDHTSREIREFVGIHKTAKGALVSAMKNYSKDEPAKILDPPPSQPTKAPELKRTTSARISRRTDRVSKAKIEMPGQKVIKVVY